RSRNRHRPFALLEPPWLWCPWWTWLSSTEDELGFPRRPRRNPPSQRELSVAYTRTDSYSCHCEERSDQAISHPYVLEIASPFGLAMTASRNDGLLIFRISY